MWENKDSNSPTYSAVGAEVSYTIQNFDIDQIPSNDVESSTNNEATILGVTATALATVALIMFWYRCNTSFLVRLLYFINSKLIV